MDKSLVINKINSMPDSLLGLVSDFLDKLMEGYEIGVKSGSDLTDDEKKEILAAIDEYETEPETGVQWTKLKAELMEKYEL